MSEAQVARSADRPEPEQVAALRLAPRPVDDTDEANEVRLLLREPGWSLGWRGWKRAMRQDSRLALHIFLAVVTITIAMVLELSYIEWCIVLAGVGARMGGELWLGSVRALGRALPPDSAEHVRAAIELGAGAVQLLMLTSALIVAVILAHHLLPLLD